MKDIKYQDERKQEILEQGIYHGYNWYILDLGTHPTAYIEIPVNNILYNKTYIDIEDKYDIDVHGGLTYSASTLLDDNKKSWYIGWDYAHINDRYGNLHKGDEWTSYEIYNEIVHVIQQIEIINIENNKDDIIDRLDNMLYLLERIESILNRTKI